MESQLDEAEGVDADCPLRERAKQRAPKGPRGAGGSAGSGRAEGDRVMDILRLATARPVDDGKATLIRRLLYDSNAIFEDQLASGERTSQERGEDLTNHAP